jgi:hypothetical protein
MIRTPSQSQRLSSRLRILGLTLMATLAFAGIAAANASALSIDKTESFLTSATSSINFKWNGNVGTCENSSGSGSFTTAKTGTAVLTFTGCKYTGIGTTYCTTPGQPTGTIKTKTLGMQLTYLDAAHSGYGLVFKGEGGKEEGYEIFGWTGLFAEVKCGGISKDWIGALVGAITSPALNQASSKASLSFAEGGSGQQQYKQYELLSGPFAGSWAPAQLSWNGEPLVLNSQQTVRFAAPRTFLP